MMQKTQKGLAKWVVRILLVLLILSFALWGLNDFVGTAPNAPVATVGDREVESQRFINEAQRRIQFLSQQQDRPIDPETAIRIGLYNQVLSGMVDNAVLAEEAEELGLGVTDDAVAAEIRDDPGFAGPGGNFDRFRFEEVLRRAGFSEGEFVESLRQDMLNRQIEASMTAGLARGPAPMARAIQAWQLESRDLRILRLPNGALATAPEPDEAALRAYHEANPAPFTAPERRSARIVLVRPQDLAENIEVSENEIEDAYEARLAEFTRPASRSVKQAIFADEAAAADVLARINEGVAFDKAVEDATGSAPIDIGRVAPGDLPDRVAEVAFAAGEGEIAGPAQSDFGWHLVHVTEVTEEKVQPLAEVREAVAQDLKLDRAIGDLVGISTRIEDELAGGAQVTEVADILSLRMIELPPVTRQGLTLEGGNPSEGLPSVALEELFAAEPGDDLAAQELDNGAILLVQTMEVVPPALQPFEDVRSEVAAAWRRERLAELAAAERAKLEQRLEGGESLEDIASGFSAEVAAAEGVTRQDGAPDLSGELRDAVFALEAGRSAGGGARGAQVLVTVDAVEEADVSGSSDRTAALSEAIGQSFSEDVRQTLLQTLRDEYGVSINQRAFTNAVDPNGIYLDQ